MNLAHVLLEKAAREDRLAHLLIFHGGSALSRKEEAVRMAQILNCSSPSEEGPCQVCNSCLKIINDNHPDVLWLKPLKTTVGIEQVLTWQQKVYLKNYEGTYKVSIIEKAEGLTLPAANALLKVVEEPPENSIIILSADNVEGILPTIQSRAQLLYFSDREDNGRLTDTSEEQREAQAAYDLSGGNSSLASAILELGLDSLQEWLEKFLNTVRSGDFLSLFPLFPVDKQQAAVYLQMLAVKIKEGIGKGANHPAELLAVGKADEALRQQGNPRLVIEVLALELFSARRDLCD